MLSFGNCQLPALLAQSAGVLGLFGNQRRVFFATLSLSVPLALHPEVTLDRVPGERPPRREAGEEKKTTKNQPLGGSGETQGPELSPQLSSVIKTAGVCMTAPTSYFSSAVSKGAGWAGWELGGLVQWQENGNLFFFFLSWSHLFLS